MKKEILKELEEQVFSNEESAYAYKIEEESAEIAKTLKEIRVKNKITMADVMKKTGLAKQVIVNIESYNGNPKLITLLKYCDAIGIDLNLALKSQSLVKEGKLHLCKKIMPK